MNDLISRQAVDKIIDDLLENDNLQASPSVWHGLHMIKQLPSAEPEKICVAKITLTDEQVKEAFEKAKCEILAVQSTQPEIIRCKDCKYNSSPEYGNACCDNFYGMTDQMGFCHYGERREYE